MHAHCRLGNKELLRCQSNAATIGGKVNGSVNAKDKLVLESKANLKGDLITKILVIEAGAKFEGKSSMGSDSKESFKPAPTSQGNETGPK